jgi:tetratricopeptide (TPR) repeat protein
VNHQEAAAADVQKLMKRGAIAAALGLIVPIIPNIFSIAFFVQAFDRSNEEFWKRKPLFAIGAVCNLAIVGVISFGLYTGYVKVTGKAYGLLSRSCFDKRMTLKSRVGGCTSALSLTHDKKQIERIHLTAGTLHLRLHKYGEAISYLQLALAEDPQSATAQTELALAQALQQNSSAPLDALVKEHSDSPRGYFVRCLYNGEQKKFLEAMSDCTLAVQLRHEFATYHEARGFAELKSGNAKDAIADYDIAIGLDKDRAPSLYGRGQAKLALGDKSGGDMDVLSARASQLDIRENFGALESLE